MKVLKLSGGRKAEAYTEFDHETALEWTMERLALRIANEAVEDGFPDLETWHLLACSEGLPLSVQCTGKNLRARRKRIALVRLSLREFLGAVSMALLIVASDADEEEPEALCPDCGEPLEEHEMLKGLRAPPPLIPVPMDDWNIN